MDWITDQLAIANYLEAQDGVLLKQQAIRSVLSLDGTLQRENAPQLGLAEIASYRLIDGAGNDRRVFGLVVADLCRLAKTQPPVMVQCHAGRSRSAIVVAAYLMKSLQVGPEEAIALVAAKREINITPELVRLLHDL